MVEIGRESEAPPTMNDTAMTFNYNNMEEKEEEEKEDVYLNGYNIFVWTLSGLIIIANVLLITIILKSKGLRTQVTHFHFNMQNTEQTYVNLLS